MPRLEVHEILKEVSVGMAKEESQLLRLAVFLHYLCSSLLFYLIKKERRELRK